MKNILLISILYLISLSVMSQKVTIQVIKTGNAALSEWQILDKQYRPVFPGSEYFKQDSVSFTLEANERYLLEISVSEIYKADTSLYSLRINGEPVMLINAKIETGDHFYPFFTGIKAEPTKIVGGANANIAEFPWQVYYESGKYLCGGSIIDQNWVVTAAHCTKNSNGNTIPADSMDIRVGASSYPTINGKKYYVSDVIVHSGFNSQTLNNDIALLKIAGPINYTNATPIKLVSSIDVAAGATDPGVMAWVTGWGLIRVTPQTLPSNLQKVQLPIVSNAQAAIVWGTIPLTDIMAGYLNGTKDACNGDSGGPLVVKVLNEYKLAGLVSWGSSNCDTYGGYTRVSALEEWIYSNTGIQENYTPASPVGDTLVCQGVNSTQYSLGAITGATSYEWQLSPSNAGVITGNSNNGTVVWTPSYIGSATIWVRATVNGTISEWSQLNVKIALNTNLISQSRDTALCSGKPVSFIINATGDDLIYTWYKNGTLLQSGNSGIFNISGTTTANTGGYICNVSGTCGTLVSNNINLTVHPLTNITYISPDTQVAFGQNATLEVRSDGYNLSYQWQKNDTLLDNSNTSLLVLQDVNATNIGLYRATVVGACGTETSDSIYVYVKKANYSNEPEIFLWPTITSDIFNVALSNDQYYNIHIYSSLGVMIREQTNCRYKTVINLANIPEGMYIVNIYNNSFKKSIRVIKR
jgi:Trypsin/Secretion system C-terminal sorting domain